MGGLGISGAELTVLVIVVLLIVFIIGIFLYLSRRPRARRDQLVTELKGRPELVQDRAFNRLAMARGRPKSSSGPAATSPPARC